MLLSFTSTSLVQQHTIHESVTVSNTDRCLKSTMITSQTEQLSHTGLDKAITMEVESWMVCVDLESRSR